MTICLQHTKPHKDQLSNWLPAPVGTFNLTMRYYTPLAPVLDKTYKLGVGVVGWAAAGDAAPTAAAAIADAAKIVRIIRLAAAEAAFPARAG